MCQQCKVSLLLLLGQVREFLVQTGVVLLSATAKLSTAQQACMGDLKRVRSSPLM